MQTKTQPKKKHLLLTIKHTGSFSLTQGMRGFAVASCAASEEAEKLSLTLRQAGEGESRGSFLIAIQVQTPDILKLTACYYMVSWILISQPASFSSVWFFFFTWIFVTEALKSWPHLKIIVY